MRIFFILLTGIHGLIHLSGFFKAFGIYEFNAINQSISKPSGIFWLLTFLLFAVTIVLKLIQANYWWLWGFLAVAVSQILIFSYWSDAKFGSLANIIILLATIIAYSNFSFRETIKQERIALLDKAEKLDSTVVSKDEVLKLPPIIQKWLNVSGVIERPKSSNVYLTQELQLKLKPEQAEWNTGTAEQYFSVHPPAFNWNINTNMNFLNVTGRDKLENGKGEMKINLLSIIPVADAKGNKKTNQATLQRYLAEIVWFPSAALSPYIKWESIDNNSARATMEINGTKGSGVFYFNDKGYFTKFVASRYKDANDAQPTEWTVTATNTEECNGVKIPTSCHVSWNLEGEQWKWLKLRIKHIEYNITEMPETDLR